MGRKCRGSARGSGAASGKGAGEGRAPAGLSWAGLSCPARLVQGGPCHAHPGRISLSSHILRFPLPALRRRRSPLLDCLQEAFRTIHSPLTTSRSYYPINFMDINYLDTYFVAPTVADIRALGKQLRTRSEVPALVEFILCGRDRGYVISKENINLLQEAFPSLLHPPKSGTSSLTALRALRPSPTALTAQCCEFPSVLVST